ncbi:MAG TPA: chromate efflux transporter [Streptosporangiaceae bacterium]|nr:chromate efflux transporter [Streptosporangiaceae bacterium]
MSGHGEPAGTPPDGTPPDSPAENLPQVPLVTIMREWGRIGCIGFGGPPAHIRLLRELCVERRGWLDAQEFEDAIAACNLLPGPASTQLAIFCAWRLRRRRGALVGGAAFIIPGLIVILALAALFLGTSPPLWVLGAGAGAGAAVPAVAIQAGTSLMGASWQRRKRTLRWLGYLIAGAAAAATIGVWLVLVLLACGVAELTAQVAADRPRHDGPGLPGIVTAPVVAAGAIGGGVLLSVAWVAFKVGALSYGGGFVIIPLMQSDAVSHYHWMTGAQFLNAVALGQITPGPVVQTVAVVGYAAAGLVGALLASVIAFTPSFAFILLGAHRFDRIRGDRNARAFLDGAGPAAIGAILGSAVPLTRALAHPWQYAVLGGALILLLLLRRGVVLTLLCAGATGVIVALTASGAVH